MSFSNVRPISTDSGIFQGTEKHRVQLSASVFCYEISKSSELACAYFPEQLIYVSHAHRFDGRRLIIGVSAPLLALAIGVPSMFAAVILSAGAANDMALGALMIAFFVMLGLSFVFAAIQAIRFFLRQRTTILQVESDDGMHEFEFWHPKGKSGELDDIVEALAVNHPRDQQSLAPTVEFEHDWSYTRPIRTAAKVMIATFLLVWFGLLRLERVLESLELGEIQVPLGIGLLFLIPIAGLASYSVSAYRLAHAEPGHKTALKHFNDHNYEWARKDADRILDAQPEDLDALMLAIHIRLRQGNLDEIGPFCRRIDEFDPELGTEIFSKTQEVWAANPNAGT